MPKWVKISLLIIPWLVLFIVVFNYFTPYLFIQWIAFRNPLIANTQLTNRALDSSYQLPNPGAYYFKNIHFDLPTTQAIVKSFNNFLVFNEGEGRRVLVTKQEPEEKELFSGKKGSILAALAATKGIRTNYDIKRYQLSLNPSAISPFQRDDLVLAVIFLPLKVISVLAPPFYSFETSFIRGFQTGNEYRIFTKADEEYSFAFIGHSQQEIDAILGSIKVQ